MPSRAFAHICYCGWKGLPSWLHFLVQDGDVEDGVGKSVDLLLARLALKGGEDQYPLTHLLQPLVDGSLLFFRLLKGKTESFDLHDVLLLLKPSVLYLDDGIGLHRVYHLGESLCHVVDGPREVLRRDEEKRITTLIDVEGDDAIIHVMKMISHI